MLKSVFPSLPCQAQRPMSLNSNWREGLRPEFELVLCSAHMRLDQKTVGRIHHILSGPLGWPPSPSNII